MYKCTRSMILDVKHLAYYTYCLAHNVYLVALHIGFNDVLENTLLTIN